MIRTPTPTRCEENVIHEEAVRTAQTRLVDGLTATHLAQTFQALSDPARVRLISALLENELCVCDLANLLDMSVSAVSHQLARLREHKLVRSRRDGKNVFYSLADDHVRLMLKSCVEHALEGAGEDG